jgi:hypothetical protein
VEKKYIYLPDFEDRVKSRARFKAFEVLAIRKFCTRTIKIRRIFGGSVK